ncbi:actin cytoskeleton-regulatory complex protein PAN1 [Scaptodrosophila lebanonensis]|uniref:UBX domain-containing protein 4 n=1 Tax=Drosophila lebanonensis TaxID=7225 RepID=A0A6J2UFN8_DROLE|nr:actin cytoskeleton-regulatory complex protein PAN1 [Scaptodrosophila lebanonensis]
MNWFSGSIADAVSASRTNNAIFVVYIEGQDEMSARLQRFVDDDRVRTKLESDDFVAIKIKGESTEYHQFRTLYQVVPVPSIFFIGKAGTPLIIATGVVASVEELVDKVNTALTTYGKLTAPRAPPISNSTYDLDSLPAGIGVELRNEAGAEDEDDGDKPQKSASRSRRKSAERKPLAENAAAENPTEDQPATSPETNTRPSSVTLPAGIKPSSPVVAADSKPSTSAVAAAAAAADKQGTPPALEKPIVTAISTATTAEKAAQRKQSKSAVVISEPKPSSPPVGAAEPNSVTADDKPTDRPLSSAAAAAEKRAALAAAGTNKVEASPDAAPDTSTVIKPPQAMGPGPDVPPPAPPLPRPPGVSTVLPPISPPVITPLPNSTGTGATMVPTVPNVANAPNVANSALTDSEMRMVEVQKILEEKKRERQEEEQRREKENELRRRREAREAQNAQNLLREQEMKNMQERIRRDRQEEQETRERIRAQIAADRAENARRNMLTSEAISVTTNTTSGAGFTTDSSLSSVNETRLQIRLPGGIHRTKAFPASEPLTTVRDYVQRELIAGSNIREFYLATSYPRREFKLEDEAKTLTELNLVPNAVVLVLTREQNQRVMPTSTSLLNMLTTVMWAMITPAAKAFDYINKMGFYRVTQRIAQTFSNLGWNKQQPNVVLIQSNARGRRNMDVFVMSRAPPQPGLPPQPQANTAATNMQHTQAMPMPGQVNQQTPIRPSSPQDSPPEQPQMVPAVQQQPRPGGGPSPQPTANQQALPSQQFQQRQGGYQPPRYGEANIRRLQDTKKDEEDKATYNGNSTQQQ